MKVRTITLPLILCALAACGDHIDAATATAPVTPSKSDEATAELRVVGVHLHPKDQRGIPLEICFSEPLNNIYAAHVRLETNDGLVLERQDVPIASSSVLLPESCTELNVGVYLLPKRASMELHADVASRVQPGNIKSIYVELSPPQDGFFFDPDHRLTEFRRNF